MTTLPIDLSQLNIHITYTYDNVNNRLTRTTPQTSAAFTYDNVYRLTQSAPGEDYTYDAVGNRLTGPNATDSMSYDNGNEMLNLNTTTFNYDLNGNRIQKNETGTSTTYTYDDENRLTSVEITGSTTSVLTYAYDPFGRRIEKNVNGTITRYVYDKEAIILEYNQAGTVTARYTHGLGIDEPFAMEKNSTMYYYHADSLGSIVALTNASGSVAQRYAYDSFGSITSGTPTITQPYTYTSREYDPETGLYFYRARYYDPKVGRFLQRDPIGFAGGFNLYAYTGNNPVNRTDPYGLMSTACLSAFLNWVEISWFAHSATCAAYASLSAAYVLYKCECGKNDCDKKDCAKEAAKEWLLEFAHCKETYPHGIPTNPGDYYGSGGGGVTGGW